jgi:hypothetical protein
MLDQRPPHEVAQLDQWRAASDQRVDVLIADHRRLAADGAPEDRIFAELVAVVLKLVDPGNDLDDERSNRLVEVGEALATAVARLARADGGSR